MVFCLHKNMYGAREHCIAILKHNIEKQDTFVYYTKKHFKQCEIENYHKVPPSLIHTIRIINFSTYAKQSKCFPENKKEKDNDYGCLAFLTPALTPVKRPCTNNLAATRISSATLTGKFAVTQQKYQLKKLHMHVSAVLWPA